MLDRSGERVVEEMRREEEGTVITGAVETPVAQGREMARRTLLGFRASPNMVKEGGS